MAERSLTEQAGAGGPSASQAPDEGAQDTDLRELAAAVGRGERRAIARAISWVESGVQAADTLLPMLPAAEAGWRIGITGPPGAGKSTLVQCLVQALRGHAPRIAVLAVDPSSPVSHGALLGDRTRMSAIAAEEGVYIRSMAARGALGGLSRATADAAMILEAAHYGTVLIETVGVGQSEIDVASVADTTVVVLNPDAGDEVQAAKAGLLEIADIIVLNKSDRPGAEASWATLRAMLDLRAQHRDVNAWPVPLVRTTASAGSGTPELCAALVAHREFACRAGSWQARRRDWRRRRIEAAVAAALSTAFWTPPRRAELERVLNHATLSGDTQALVARWLEEFQRADS